MPDPGAEDRIEVTPELTIRRSEIRMEAARSGGPGGQNVNKVASKVVLRFSIAESPSLGEAQREKLAQRLASRLTRAGELVLHASTHRERRRNEQEAIERLVALLRDGLHEQRARRKTRPTRGSVKRRLDTKRRQGERKKGRQEPPAD